MTASGKAVMAYPRLCIAHFCQFAIWGAWAGALGEYAGRFLQLTGGQIGSLYNAIPLGAVIAPLFIGPIVDKYFAAQKVMSVLHFIGGLALLLCGWLCISGSQSFGLLMGLMFLSGACYMSTMGLINSIIFKHLPNPGMAPYVFVFGTIGWIIVNLYIAGWCGGATTPYFFLVGGSVSVFLAFYALTLPNTPPKSAEESGEKSGGLAVMSLFKDFSFVIFVVCAFLASIPACNYFFPSYITFLTERGYPSPVALGTINQFAEILFMLALPFCIPRFGLKNVLLIGMGAWALRYICFSFPGFELALMGLLLHGFGYTFLYVASYMYAEKVAPAHLKASAQSMMVFLLLGVGQVLGGFAYGYMKDTNLPVNSNITVAGTQFSAMPEGFENVNVPIPEWNDDEDSMFQYLDLAKQVQKFRGIEEKTEAKLDLGKLLAGQPLTPQNIDAMDDSQLVLKGVTVSEATVQGVDVKLVKEITGNVRYTKDDLKQFGSKIAKSDNFSLTRDDWLAAQAHNWERIYRYPAYFIIVCFVIFLLLGKNPKEEKNG